MSNSKISALPSATTPLAGTEVLPVVQSSTTKQVSIANLTAGRSVSAADYVMSTGNLVPSTAAKGINFTANTPAAGMTSQLLNWYEEGTWTPSFSHSGGSTPTQTSTGKYTRVGNLVYFSFYCTFSSAQTEPSYYDTTFVFQSGVTFTNVGAASVQGTSTQYAIEGITTSRLRVYLIAAAVTVFTGFGTLRV